MPTMNRPTSNNLPPGVAAWMIPGEEPPEEHDPAICYNCGCYGRQPEPEHYPGLYICRNCGDEWDICAEPPDVP